MKPLALCLMATLFMVVVASLSAQKNTAYTGVIIDSMCAKMGSHEATGKNPPLTAKGCTIACIEHGAKYVLYDGATKTIYQLDDQIQPEQFAGAKVAVTGTLDDTTKTIHIANIKPAF